MNGHPMWIPTPGGQVFAWYHSPARETVRRAAVLLCDPFGWHRMVLHTTYREIALRLSAAGFPVLRVDYPGTCDSEGEPRQAARLETWLASLDAAADVVKAASGARELALFGALLGGSFAVMFAARRSDVTTLVLWGAYPQGRTAVRTEIAAAAAATPLAEQPLPPGGVKSDREAFGFLLTAEFIEDMRRVDLLGAAVPNVRRALVLPRAVTPTDSKRLAAHLVSGGAAVELRETALDDLEGILHSAGAGHPKATIDDIATWLERQFPELEAARATPAPGPAEVVLSVAGTRVRESAVFFGAHGSLFGITSEPLERRVREPAIVLVSGGRNHRSGINRNYTEWARKLASLGHRVLRIDLRGLGDSPLGHGRRTVLYSREARHDVLDAVAWLNEHGAKRVACIGLCAGSYQAFHAALSARSVNALMMLNPLAFHSDRASDSDGPTPLRKALRRIRRGARRLGRRALPEAWFFSERKIAASFVGLVERGVDVCIVYSDNEPYLRFLERALLPVRKRLAATGHFRIETVGQSDHIFSPLAVQAQVTATLIAYVAELTGRAADVSCSNSDAPVLGHADNEEAAIEQQSP